MFDAIYLIVPDSGTQNAIGVYEPSAAKRKRKVLGENIGISRSEFTAAGQSGYRAEFAFQIPFVDYHGEHEAEYAGRRFSIYRTYPANGGWDVEIYLGTKVGVTQ